MDKKSPMKIFETEVSYMLTENARKMLREAEEKDARRHETMYKSPIEIIYQEMQTHVDDDILRAVQSYNINVDRDELIKALNYDRDQYRKGFEDGKKAGPDWIPITTEKITQKEKEELAEKYDVSPEEFNDCWRYTCPLPEDGQQVLVTTHVWGYVAITEFNIDEDGIGSFQDYDDETDITAWMPLPAPYTTDHQEESND